jgi:hypothetical protein
VSEAQRQIVAAASALKSGLVLPVTSNLKGGALKRCSRLCWRAALLRRLPTADPKQEVWRTNDEGVALTLKLTKAGREVFGGKRKERAKKPATPAQRERGDTKQAKVIAMLRSKKNELLI